MVKSPHVIRSMPAVQSLPGAQSGFTLIEVLVAILVLCFGMLGVVGLQAAALQANKEARYQSSAVRLSRELADMMRGNKVVAIQTAGNPYLGDFTDAAQPAAPPEDCYTVKCNSAVNVAKYQIYDWFQRANGASTSNNANVRAAGELPDVRAVICFDDSPYDAGGQPQWACSNAGAVAVLKLGWTHQSLNRAADGTTGNATVDRGADTKPSFIVPLIAGNI